VGDFWAKPDARIGTAAGIETICNILDAHAATAEILEVTNV
jgi:hypothetical protein